MIRFVVIVAVTDRIVKLCKIRNKRNVTKIVASQVPVIKHTPWCID